jgi:hypothetical protein
MFYLNNLSTCSVCIICPLVLSARFVCLSFLSAYSTYVLVHVFFLHVLSVTFFCMFSLHVSTAFSHRKYFVCIFFLLFSLHNLSASSGCIVCEGVQSAYMYVFIICLSVLSACHIWMFCLRSIFVCMYCMFCLHVSSVLNVLSAYRYSLCLHASHMFLLHVLSASTVCRFVYMFCLVFCLRLRLLVVSAYFSGSLYNNCSFIDILD